MLCFCVVLECTELGCAAWGSVTLHCVLLGGAGLTWDVTVWAELYWDCLGSAELK